MNEGLVKHHMRAFKAWWSAKQRCYNPNNKAFKYYGSLGISMFPGWVEDFPDFLNYMGDPPTGLSLDRFPDPSGNYEPGNLRWATPEQQSRNQRKNHKIWESGLSPQDIKRKRWNEASKRYKERKKMQCA
jgi:hypothetical protein